MEKLGRSLKQPAKIRMQALKLGLKRFKNRMRDEMVGEARATTKLIEKVAEALEIDHGKIRLRKEE